MLTEALGATLYFRTVLLIYLGSLGVNFLVHVLLLVVLLLLFTYTYYYPGVHYEF